MLKKIIKSYYKLLDEKLESWPIIILIIAFLIIWVSLVISDTNAIYKTKTSIFERSTNNSLIEIDWKKYKINLEEIKD